MFAFFVAVVIILSLGGGGSGSATPHGGNGGGNGNGNGGGGGGNPKPKPPPPPLVDYTIGYDAITIHRPKIIYFEFQGLRPNIPHWLFFGARDVTKYVNTSYTLDDYNSAGRKSNIKEPGDNFIKGSAFPTSLGGPTAASGPLYTTSTGELKGFFYLQSNTDLSFPVSAFVGTQFVASDISVLNPNEALSYAVTTFKGLGQTEFYYQSRNGGSNSGPATATQNAEVFKAIFNSSVLAGQPLFGLYMNS